MAKAKPLYGLGIVVTRPEHQAEPLCQRLSSLGANVIRCPLLQITASELKPPQQRVFGQLSLYDLAIFISPNAVTFALKQLRGDWPIGLKIAAVGQGSARTLQQHQFNVDFFPKERFNSEALLELPSMQNLQNQRIVIFRGQGGREYLAQQLKKRGATVDYLEFYQRRPTPNKSEVLLPLWQQNKIQLIIITSSKSLNTLYAMVGTGSQGRAYLEQTPLLLISKRTQRLAVELGFKNWTVISPQASDLEISNTIIKHADRMTLDQNHE
ncbi:MAG: uroporphyrinogen-III synthase [Gammaproteobacteria bacterium]|nr:uroporphyrinogen-III synthase [Gammaproteobacteria bacterium]